MIEAEQEIMSQLNHDHSSQITSLSALSTQLTDHDWDGDDVTAKQQSFAQRWFDSSERSANFQTWETSQTTDEYEWDNGSQN